MYKTILKKSLISGILISSLLISKKTSAEIVEQQVTPQRINLAFNKGINIKLTDPQSVIKNIWLDNPTFGVLSFDKCVIGYNNCQVSNATVAHIKRIEDLKLKNIPYGTSSLLTIITENTETNATDIHFFTVVKAQHSSSPLFTIEPEQANVAQTNPVLSASGMTPEELADKVTATLANPQIKEKIGNAERAKLVQFANLLVLGTPEYQAMNLTGISPELIKTIASFKYSVKP